MSSLVLVDLVWLVKYFYATAVPLPRTNIVLNKSTNDKIIYKIKIISHNADWSNGKVNSLSVSNCFFNGTSTTYGFFGFSMVGYNPSVSTFDHCTFN